MNALQKYEENQEQEKVFPPKSKAHSKEPIYYLQRRLRMLEITYSSREKIVFATSEETENKYVKELSLHHNYTVQTIIK